MTTLTATLVITILMIVGFIFNSKIPFALTGFATILALVWANVLPMEDALSFLSNSSIIMIGATSIVAAALLKTDILDKIVRLLSKLGTSERIIVTEFCVIMAVLSQITQPMVVLSLLCPLIYSSCKSYGISPARVVLPVGFTGIVWVGTIPIAHGAAAWGRYEALLETMGMPGMGIWDLTLPRLPGCVLSLIFVCLWGYKLCPTVTTGTVEVPKQPACTISLSKGKQNAAYIIFLLTTVGMFTSSLTGLNVTLIACAGAAAVAIFRIIDEKEIYRSLPMGIIFMLAGTLALAEALVSSGAGNVIGNLMISFLGQDSSQLTLMLVFFLTPFVLTQFMSNTAVDSMFSPILLVTCDTLGINAIPYLSALRVASSCSVLTPMATATIPVIMMYGGYRIKDIVKFSLIPMLIVAVSSMVLTLLVRV